ncbi:bacteriocin biosynthesis cyclodehydratase, SagC family [Clostridium putrefaciens]|uniref:Bacteriocin biosynthesis cyclodehydratase, SagC family n=2 Tax=Clostridium putrefaciens TaxID=99675 RepID=A0A381J5K5_9CLOT|nr:bacteriocin biosynthesis cyclodehydratase, SagC family [Clostridium putrefaciens]
MDIERYIFDVSNYISFIDSSKVVIKATTKRFQVKGDNISTAIRDIIDYFTSPISISEVVLLLKDRYSENSLKSLISLLIDKKVLIDESYSEHLKMYSRDYLEKIRYYSIGEKTLESLVDELNSMNIGIIGHKQFIDCLLYELLNGGLFLNFNLGVTDRIDSLNTYKEEPTASITYFPNITEAKCLDDFVEKSDFIIVSSNYRDHYLYNRVNEACLKRNKEWVRIMIDGNYSEIGPLFIPDITSCYSCLNIREVSNMTEDMYVFDDLDKNSKIHEEQRNIQIGLYSIYHFNHLVSGIACSEIMKYFTGIDCNLLSQVVRINSDDYEVQKEKIFRYHSCPTCSERR